MTEHKYTDEEVIRALECCKDADCENCLRWSKEWYSGQCADLLPSVLDLINRQREEIEVIKETTAEIRYEAIKEFEGKLKSEAHTMQMLNNGAYYRVFTDWQIEKIAKEMMGETK